MSSKLSIQKAGISGHVALRVLYCPFGYSSFSFGLYAALAGSICSWLQYIIVDTSLSVVELLIVFGYNEVSKFVICGSISLGTGTTMSSRFIRLGSPLTRACSVRKEKLCG